MVGEDSDNERAGKATKSGHPYGAKVEVSVVIPSLDVNSPVVHECVQAVKATMPVPHEVIVIDNGAPPQGFTGSVNAGLRAARGRYLVVLNDDVEVLDGWWEPLARALDADNPVVFPMTAGDGQGVRNGQFQAWCFALRRETLERFAFTPGEFLDPALSVWYSDTDLLLRLSAAGVPPVYVPESQIRHEKSRTVDLEHPDDGYRTWLHAQIASDRAAFQVKHPLYPGGPSPAITPEHLPLELADGPIALQADGPGWHSRTLPWPEEVGHFFLTGELALSAQPGEISVQFVFADEEDRELFYFNLVPGVLGSGSGHFCLTRERAKAVAEQFRGQGDPAWPSVRKLVVRCACEHDASVIVTNLRAFAEPATARSQPEVAMSHPEVKPATLAYRGIREPPPPPDCPPGWRTGPPDFIGVGAQRCGTTRWFDLIVAHPEVIAPPGLRKELHFFDRFHAGGFTAPDAAAYHQYFPRPEPKLTGEWTPLYLAAFWVPEMLAQAAPQARLLVLLRDPVERYISGLQHHHRQAEFNRSPLDAAAPLDAYLRGLYGAQLEALLAHFDRSQLLVQQYERCTREPLAELRRSYEFLGLKHSGFTLDLEAHPNRQPGKRPLHPDARRALVEAYRDDVARLVDRFPEIDLTLWPNFSHLAG